MLKPCPNCEALMTEGDTCPECDHDERTGRHCECYDCEREREIDAEFWREHLAEARP